MSKHVGSVAPDNGLGIGLTEEMRKKVKNPEELNRTSESDAKRLADQKNGKLGLLEKPAEKPQVRKDSGRTEKTDTPKQPHAEAASEGRAKAKSEAENAYMEHAAFSKSLGELANGKQTNGTNQAAAKPKVFGDPNTAAKDGAKEGAKNGAGAKQVDPRHFAASQATGFTGVVNGKRGAVEEASRKQGADNQPRKNAKEGEQKQTAAETGGKKRASEGEGKNEPKTATRGTMDMAGMAGVGQSANIKEKTQLPEKSVDNKKEETLESEEGRSATPHTAASIANRARKHLESGAGGAGGGSADEAGSGLAFEIPANRISIDKISNGEVDTVKTCGVDFINRVEGDASTEAKIASLQLENTIKSIKDGAAKATIDALITNHSEAALTDRVVSAVVDEAKALIAAFRERGRRGVYGGMQA